MSKILILSESGFGKTTSIGPVPKEEFEKGGIYGVEIKGLNPAETFIISVTNKGLPIPKWRTFYKTVTYSQFLQTGKGNHIITNDGDQIADIILKVALGPKLDGQHARRDIKNIVLDDSNYIMQDLYMSKVWTGYDIFKKLGVLMGKIFNAAERISAMNLNFIMMAHFEEYKNSNDDTISFRYKTVGKMVQDYITPEGKFEIVLFGKQSIEQKENTSVLKKVYVTNYDGRYPAKSPVGMFDLYIPNDLGYVVDCIREYEGVATPDAN